MARGAGTGLLVGERGQVLAYFLRLRLAEPEPPFDGADARDVTAADLIGERAGGQYLVRLRIRKYARYARVTEPLGQFVGVPGNGSSYTSLAPVSSAAALRGSGHHARPQHRTARMRARRGSRFGTRYTRYARTWCTWNGVFGTNT